jgi:hypothetical protein
MSDALLGALLSAVVSGSVAAAVISAFLRRRTATIEQAIKLQFDRMAESMSSQRAWKERAVAELLGPVNMQLDRTQRAFDRWTQQNLFLEAKVIGEGNRGVRRHRRIRLSA